MSCYDCRHYSVLNARCDHPERLEPPFSVFEGCAAHEPRVTGEPARSSAPARVKCIDCRGGIREESGRVTCTQGHGHGLDPTWSCGKGEPRDVAPRASALPKGSQERKAVPIVRGCLDYFPAALAAVAAVSKAGNDQHNPGEELHHARGKSMDHADCIVRHLMDRGTVDTDGQPHSAKVAWRALALLQEELEAAGAPLARGARLPEGE